MAEKDLFYTATFEIDYGEASYGMEVEAKAFSQPKALDKFQRMAREGFWKDGVFYPPHRVWCVHKVIRNVDKELADDGSGE